MCGIVGALAVSPANQLLYDALRARAIQLGSQTFNELPDDHVLYHLETSKNDDHDHLESPFVDLESGFCLYIGRTLAPSRVPGDY